MDLEVEINQLLEVYNERLKRLINSYWDLIDMMVYEGYKVDWSKVLDL